MSLEAGFCEAKPVSKKQFTPHSGKIKPLFRLFTDYLCNEGRKDAARPGVASLLGELVTYEFDGFCCREARTAVFLRDCGISLT